MDRDRLEAHMRAFAELLDDDNPPLVAVVVLANGDGQEFSFPYLERISEGGSLAQREAVVRIMRAQYLLYVEALDGRLGALRRAQGLE